MTPVGHETIGPCDIAPTARVCSGAVIGKRFRPLLGVVEELDTDTATVIGANAYIGCYAIIGAGTSVEPGVIVDDFSIVECDVRLGEQSLVIYRAQICNEARIGRSCVIGGFIAERVVVGHRARVFGKIVHSHLNPRLGWDAPEAEELSATIGDDVFIGFDAIVIGRVNIGAGAYVCAGSIVTRDVPPKSVAFGINKSAPSSQWKGGLRVSPFFR